MTSFIEQRAWSIRGPGALEEQGLSAFFLSALRLVELHLVQRHRSPHCLRPLSASDRFGLAGGSGAAELAGV